MSLACRRARGTATRLIDLAAFGGRVAGARRVPGTRPFASASLARARELLAPTPFDVQVGATVRVAAPRAWTGLRACPADVDVRMGDAYETVTVQASWMNPEEDADAAPPTVTAIRTEDGDVAVHLAGGGGGSRARVSCRIPPRFVGVDIRSGGGEVFVESVVEATVRVESDGGSVEFGSVRGAAARVDTNGGGFVAKNVVADAAVDTAGGSVGVGKLVGRRVRVRSLGGDVRLEAAYAAVLDVDTAGGALELGEARAGKSWNAETRGGTFRAAGFAGDADARCAVDTAGGACALELRAEAPGSLRVRTHGGDVALGVPEGFAADLRVSGRVGGEEVVEKRGGGIAKPDRPPPARSRPRSRLRALPGTTPGRLRPRAWWAGRGMSPRAKLRPPRWRAGWSWTRASALATATTPKPQSSRRLLSRREMRRTTSRTTASTRSRTTTRTFSAPFWTPHRMRWVVRLMIARGDRQATSSSRPGRGSRRWGSGSERETNSVVYASEKEKKRLRSLASVETRSVATSDAHARTRGLVVSHAASSAKSKASLILSRCPSLQRCSTSSCSAPKDKRHTLQ